MALNKLKFNSINVTPTASEAIRFNSGANGFETASAGGSLVKIASSTASSSSTVSFTSGINSTYKEYIFFFNNLHLSNDGAQPGINFSIDSGSNYNVAKTSSNFSAAHNEADSSTLLGYNGSWDLAQGTGLQYLTAGTGNANDESASGYLHLFDPSNTTFVKHFIAQFNSYVNDSSIQHLFIGGYANTTSAIDAVQFGVSAGTIDSGTISLYGVL
jgi:hypothetical protein